MSFERLFLSRFSGDGGRKREGKRTKGVSVLKGKLLYMLGLIVVMALAVWVNGPQVVIDTSLHPLSLPADLDGYLARREAVFSDLVPGTEKKIVWAGVPGEQTPLAIVFVHGFSASRQEIAPVPALLAANLGANLFSTRLTGHGRGGEAMLEGSVNAWVNDLEEATEIGRRLGRRVVLMGNSTGATLAAWQSIRGDSDLAALVLLSPNFGPIDKRTVILTWPWGAQLAESLVGKTRSWRPENEAHGRFWTTSYPVRALLPMMGVVKLANNCDWSSLQTPVLMICSPRDQTVDSETAARVFEKIGSPIKSLVWFDTSSDPSQHILAGDILSPGSTAPLVQILTEFLSQLPKL